MFAGEESKFVWTSSFCCRIPVRMNSAVTTGTEAERAEVHSCQSSSHETTTVWGWGGGTGRKALMWLCSGGIRTKTFKGCGCGTLCEEGILGRKVAPLQLKMSFMCTGSGLTDFVTWILYPCPSNRTKKQRKSLDWFFSIFVHFCDTQAINTKHFKTHAFSFALLAKISKSLLQCSRKETAGKRCLLIRVHGQTL